jgi:hypothetical protein
LKAYAEVKRRREDAQVSEGVPYKDRAFLVKQENVNQLKRSACTEAEAAKMESRTSTNDILTWRFFEATQPFLAYILLDLRGKLPDCADNLAGNYVAPISYRPPDYASPLLIRQSVKTWRRAAMPSTSLPSDDEYAAAYDSAPVLLTCVTNPSSFSKEIDLEGCEQVAHVMHHGSDKPRLLIFKSRKDEHGVWINGFSQNEYDKLRKSPFFELLGEPIIDGDS